MSAPLFWASKAVGQLQLAARGRPAPTCAHSSLARPVHARRAGARTPSQGEALTATALGGRSGLSECSVGFSGDMLLQWLRHAGRLPVRQSSKAPLSSPGFSTWTILGFETLSPAQRACVSGAPAPSAKGWLLLVGIRMWGPNSRTQVTGPSGKSATRARGLLAR